MAYKRDAAKRAAKAPEATPLNWNELNDAKLNAQTYTIHSIF